MHEAKLNISGKVQGVSFRIHAQETATRLNLAGYAKNLPDGTVEALLQGAEENINAFIDWAKEGSSSAEVTNINASWQTPTQIYDSFEIY